MREDIEFDAEGVTLRGWFYKPEGVPGEAPCIIMTHGFSCTKEMGLEPFAEAFSAAGFACVVYDHRGFGASDTAPGKPRQEIDPWDQIHDTQHAITYAQGRPDVDAARIGVWGSSYSGGNAFVVAAIDRRVKAVCGQVPAVAGRRTFETNVPKEYWQAAWDGQAADRLARARGEAPAMIPVVTADPTAPAVMPTPDAYEFFSAYEGSAWRNEVTLRSTELGYEAGEFLKFVAPTPLLMVIAEDDNVVTPGEWAKEAYETAAEPKRLVWIPGGHFDAYTGEGFKIASGAALEFFAEHLSLKVSAPVSQGLGTRLSTVLERGPLRRTRRNPHMSTLAGDLARALGDVVAMQQLYAEDISWTLPVTLGRIGGTHEGKEAVVAFNKISLAAYDKAAGTHVDIHEEFDAEGGRSVARIRVRSTVGATGEGYENEYVLLVRGRDGKIVEVVEYLDTLKVMHYEGLRRFLPAIPGVVVS